MKASIHASINVCVLLNDKYLSGKQLYESAVDVCDIRFISFPAELGLGHSNIYLDDNYNDIVNEFVQSL